jgi:cytoskeletal protein CcmA (bactofilin family)
MWKSNKKEDERLTPAPAVTSALPVAPIAASNARVIYSRLEVPPKMADIAHIGKSVIIRGELSGSEDLFLDGEVEGSIELKSHSLTIGPNGRIRANIQAKEVVIHGRVDGNVRATDRAELKQSAVLAGDIVTQRIMIEDGAFFKGAVDIQKVDAKAEAKPDVKPEAKPEPHKEPAAAPAPPATSFVASTTAH